MFTCIFGGLLSGFSLFIGTMLLFSKEAGGRTYHDVIVDVLVVLGSCLLIFGILGILKIVTMIIHKMRKFGAYEKAKLDVLIGFGIIFIFGFVPRILTFFTTPEYYSQMSFYSLITYPITCFLTMLLFQLAFTRGYELIPNPKLIITMLTVHILILIASLRILVIVCPREVDRTRNMLIGFCQVGYGILCTLSSIEFMIVWSGGLEKQTYRYEEEGGEELGVLRNTDSVMPIARIMPKIDCKICLHNYSTTYRIPRILTECGHTICQKCAANLLNQNDGRLIFCPFCQVVTAVNGQAHALALNRAVWSYIIEIEKKSKPTVTHPSLQ